MIGNRVFVVGGAHETSLSSVEYLEFSSATESNRDVIFASSWVLDKKLSLVERRLGHAVLGLGTGLVVGGGHPGSTFSDEFNSVKVIDTEASVVWNLPNMTIARSGFSMVATSNGIVVIGGIGGETLPLLTKKQQLKV